MTSKAWGQSGASVRRAAITLLVMVLAATGAWAQTGKWENFRATSLTESDDHETIYISTAEELALYAYNVNHGRRNARGGFYCDLTVELQADIDLSAHYWTPIGNGENCAFKGRFNGNGHVITGMNVNSDYCDLNYGFIGYFYGKSNTYIDNIIFKDCHVSGSIPLVSAGGVGIVVGYYLVNGTGSGVTNCLVLDCSVDEINAVESNPKHGAIIGYCFGGYILSNNYYYNMTGDYGGGIGTGGGVKDVYEATRAYAVTLPEGITANSNITANPGISHGGKFYTKDGATVTLAISHSRPGYTFLGYSSDDVTITDGAFYMPEKDVTIDAIWANPDDISISDDGTEYTIKTAEGWNVFCNLLEGGETFRDKTVYLGASITVSRMAGDGAHGFAGTFDGQNNTLTFNYGTAESPADEQFVAPFSFTVSGTSPVFRDLTIDGDIYATHTEPTINDHAGGLIAHLFGTVTIDNCVSNVRITTTGEDGAGGFVGLCEHSVKFTNCKSSAVVTSDGGNNSGFVGWSRSSEYLISFDGCLFNGKLLMKDNNGGYNGGFVGWKGDGKTVTIENCLYIPAEPVGSEKFANSYIANFCRQHDDKLPADIKNCYYISSNTDIQYYGAVQGKKPLSVTAGENVTVEAVSPVGDATKIYSVSGITAYAKGITYNDTFYYGSGDQVNLTLSHGDAPEGYAFIGYTASPAGATLTGITNPYTLTMPDGDVQIGAKYADSEPYIDENGEGQTCADYIFITSDMTTLGSEGEETWYVVNGDVTINDNLEVKGDVHLILADDASLTTMYDFYDNPDNGTDYLTIYGQNKGNGKLNFTGGCFVFSSSLTINGGEIVVDTEDDGFYFEGGSLTINGGKVDVEAQEGCGFLIDTGNLTINGGKVDVKAQNNGFDIYNGSLTINGGEVNAKTQYGWGIFIGNGSLTINGGEVNARSEHNDDLYALVSTITFGWIRPEDHIYFSTYFFDNSTLNIASGQTLTDGTNTYTGSNINVDDLNGETLFGVDVLYDDKRNDIASLNGKHTNVLLSGRTLYDDGYWNTLCLPFDLKLSGSVLDGDNVELMTLGDASFSNGTLTLDFVDADEIKAGVPYIIRWNGYYHIVNPVFKNVTIENASLDENAFTNDVISFKGIYSPTVFVGENKDVLYLGDDSRLYYPSSDVTINAFRAYFELQGGLTAGEPVSTDGQEIKSFVLNFGEETGIQEINLSNPSNPSNSYFSLDGRHLDNPSSPGLYIHNGCKVLIK